MSHLFLRTSRCHGNALAPLLCLLAGLLVGLAVCLLPRLWNVDPMEWFRPPPQPEPKPAAVKDELTKVELRSLIADVKKQRAALEEREQALTARATELDQQGVKNEALRRQMDEVQQRVDAQVAEAKKILIQCDAAEQVNVGKLAKMWAQMEPAEVASLIKNLDTDVAAKVMANMQERQAAPILGEVAKMPNAEKLAAELVEKLKKIKRPEKKKENL